AAEEFDRPRFVRVDPEDRAGDFAAPRADQAGKGDDLAAADVETDVVEHPGLGEVLDFQHDVARGRFDLGEEVVHLAPNHLGDQRVGTGVLDGRGVDIVPVPQHG